MLCLRRLLNLKHRRFENFSQFSIFIFVASRYFAYTKNILRSMTIKNRAFHHKEALYEDIS